MVKRTAKEHEGAPSRAVDSIDCARMNASGSDPKTATAKTTNGKATARRRWPSMTMHSSGQARVRLNGKAHYLGAWGSPEAHERYATLLKQWEANGREPIGPRPITAVEAMLTVSDLSAQYLAWIDGTRRYHKGGKPTSQRRVAGRALSLFEEFAGAVPVRRLNEALLIQWRDRLEAEFPRWTRNTINRTVAHALRMLAWGRARQLVPKDVWADCALVEPLERGACANRPERARPRRAVSVADVEKVAQHCCNQVAAMMRLQLCTSMRPGDVCAMRWADIDKDGPNGTWVYTRDGAKTEHHGHVTRYLLGTAAQKILEQFPALPTACIFSPAKAMADRHAARKRQRKGCGMRRTFNSKWHPVCYRQHVVAACEKAKVQTFTPHELRHAAITHVTNAVGLVAASAAANHRSVAVTAGYVHASTDESVRAAAALDRLGSSG
jgi:integrase